MEAYYVAQQYVRCRQRCFQRAWRLYKATVQSNMSQEKLVQEFSERQSVDAEFSEVSIGSEFLVSRSSSQCLVQEISVSEECQRRALQCVERVMIGCVLWQSCIGGNSM
jgi:hypothetical protein